MTTPNAETSSSAAGSIAPGLLTTKSHGQQDEQSGLSTNYMIAIVCASVFLLFMLIFALYKYRNRDEGTYTIDETKNCGPFAELDMPLNGANQMNGKSSKKHKNKRSPIANVNNKEWYV